MEVGTYIAQVIAFELGFAGTGTPEAMITFAREDDGETVTTYRYLSEKAIEFAIKDFRTCGWQGTEVGEITVEDLNERVQIVVQEKKNQDGTYGPDTDVRWINAIGERTGVGIKNAMTAAQKQEFSERMRGIAMSIPAKGAPAAAPTPAPAPAPMQATGARPAGAAPQAAPARQAAQAAPPARPAAPAQRRQAPPAAPPPEPLAEDDLPF